MRASILGLALVAAVATACGGSTVRQPTSAAAARVPSTIPSTVAPTTSTLPPGSAPVGSLAPTTTAAPPAPPAPAAAAPAAPATAAPPLPVIDLAGNSMLFDAELSLQRALAPAPFHNHTVGGLGLSVQPELWQGVFGGDVAADHPAVVVVMLGNRDFPVAIAQPDVYRGELDQAMRVLTAVGARVLLLGLPPLPPNVLDEQGRVAVNALLAEVPARFPGLVRYVPTDTVLGAPDGSWARSLPDANGNLVPVRKENPDGTGNEHLCPEGAVRITSFIRREVASIVALPPEPVGWQDGEWRSDHRFDDPPNGCRP